MYNQKLHYLWMHRLKEDCNNKRVLIVGNSIKLCGSEYGKLIDSYDFVVRLGKGITHPRLIQFTGTKTDCWMTGLMRVNNYVSFKDAKYKILMYIPLTPNSELVNINVGRVFFTKNFQIYKDYFTVGSLGDVGDITEYPIVTTERPSQGYVAANFFLKKVNTFKSLSIIGFDFFESKFVYEREGSINEVSSFHIPLPLRKGTNSNPHAHSEKTSYEKQFFLEQEALGNLQIHRMHTNPTPETIKTLMTLFRSDGEFVELN